MAFEAKRRDRMGDADAARLIEHVKGGSAGAHEELCSFMVAAARPFVMRTLTSREVSEQIDDSIMFVRDAICMGALRAPESVATFARVVLHHQLFDLKAPVH
jgi:hypothetical protein